MSRAGSVLAGSGLVVAFVATIALLLPSSSSDTEDTIGVPSSSDTGEPIVAPAPTEPPAVPSPVEGPPEPTGAGDGIVFTSPIRTDGKRENLLGRTVFESSKYADTTLNLPVGAAVGENGDIYIAETFNNVIKKLDVDDEITWVAGTGIKGYNGDGDSSATQLSIPTHLEYRDGMLYFLDTENYLLRRVVLNENRIETIAGIPGTPGFPVEGRLAREQPINYATTFALTDTGDFIIPMSDLSTPYSGDDLRLYLVRSDGGIEELDIPEEARSAQVVGIVADQDGVFLNHVEPIIEDGERQLNGNRRLLQLNYEGELLADIDLVDSAGGGLVRLEGTDRFVYGAGTFIGDVEMGTGEIGNFSDGLYANVSDILTAADSLYVTDSDKGKLIEISKSGDFVRENGAASSVVPKAVVDGAFLDDDHLLLVDNLGGRILNYSISTGDVTVFAGNGRNEPAIVGDKMLSGFSYPSSIAIDAAGSVFVNENHRILKIDGDGALTVYSGNEIAGDVSEVPRDDAKYTSIRRLRVDNADNLFVADTYNNKIKRIDPSGFVTTILSDLNHPNGMEIREDGVILVADSWNSYVVQFDGVQVLPVAGSPRFNAYYQDQGADCGDGGPALDAELNTPYITASTDSGIFVLDTFNNKVKYVDNETSLLRTVLGDGLQGYSEDSFNFPTSMFIRDGFIYVIDTGNFFVSRFRLEDALAAQRPPQTDDARCN